MVGAPVHAINHGVSRALELVIEAVIDEAPDDGNVEAFASEHVARRRDPGPSRRKRFRRRKPTTTPLVQHRSKLLVAELYGGDIDHRAYLQSNPAIGNPLKPTLSIQIFIDAS